MFCFGSNKKFNNFNIYDKNITKKSPTEVELFNYFNNLGY